MKQAKKSLSVLSDCIREAEHTLQEYCNRFKSIFDTEYTNKIKDLKTLDEKYEMTRELKLLRSEYNLNHQFTRHLVSEAIHHLNSEIRNEIAGKERTRGIPVKIKDGQIVNKSVIDLLSPEVIDLIRKAILPRYDQQKTLITLHDLVWENKLNRVFSVDLLPAKADVEEIGFEYVIIINYQN